MSNGGVMSGQGEVKPSWSAFVNSVSTSLLNQALLIGAAAAVVLAVARVQKASLYEATIQG